MVLLGVLLRDQPPSSNAAFSSDTTTTTTTTGEAPLAPPRASPSVATENLRVGDPGWPVTDDPAVWAKVRGFADRVSAQRGETFGLYVSTKATSFTVTAVRMGWYGGAGGRVVWTSAAVPGVAQAGAQLDKVTGMRSAPWAKSLDVAITDDWVPGMYILKLVSDDGGQSMVPLTVRDDASHAAVLIGSGVTTWQAYNGWGGSNLYSGDPGADPKRRAKVVSFDRPYDGNGTGEYFGREDQLVQMVESMGLDVTYTTDIDVHAAPQLLLNHQAYVVPTHDEYWSLEMRDGVEAARDHGVNLVFVGANAAFRRTRFEPSPLGENRHEVNYRVAKDDPLNGKDDARVTTSWRDSPKARPESSLIGDYYECNPVDADMVIADASSWVFAGTGLKNGDHLAHVVGNEYDRVTPEAPTPDGIAVIAHSPVQCRKLKSYSDMSYYTAASGAGVLATGTLAWEPHLGPPCAPDVAPGQMDCQIRAAMVNVLSLFASGPAGTSHPSRSNLESLGIHRGYVTGHQ
ncbi:MAG: N,N-dimethylformamidase beta subunit family domain-containing protein [Acidimicrobiales bacterium]